MRRIPNTPEYYFAGEDGHIYSRYSGVLKRLKSAKSSSGTGYLQVNIKGSKSVHRLIFQAFNGTIPSGKVISHKDGNMYNNKPNNLLCETQKENLARKLEHGTLDNGFNNSRASLSEEDFNKYIADVTEIRSKLKNKLI